MSSSQNTYDKILSVDWNGQYFILTARNEITGNSFAYAYSSDGVSWSKSNLSSDVTTHNTYAAKYLGDKFIVTGNLTSSSLDAFSNTINTNCLVDVVDGQYPVTLPTNFAGNTIVYDIERNLEQPNRIVFPKTVALSLGTTISYSFDQGLNWTAVSSPPFSTSANDAIWNGKIWVAVGTGAANTIATSLDGVNWIGRGNSTFSAFCNGIDWSPEQHKFVAVGSGANAVATSMDGIYWRGLSTIFSGAGANDIKWNGKLWVAAGNTAASGNTIAYSSDAITWQYAANSFQTAGLRVYYDTDAAIWTIYGTDPTYNIATSSDGIHWALSNVSGATVVSLNMPTGLFADTSLNMYPGISFPLYQNAATTVAKYCHNHSDRGCAYIQPITIAGGSGGANSLAYSIDGIQWTSIPNPIFSTRCNKIIWNGTLWAAVGAGSAWVATSYNGLTWTAQNNSIMTECYDIAWNGSYFVAVGVGAGGASLATSPDGMTWTAVNISSIFTTNIHAIEWTGVVWLAYGAGTNTTAISSNIDASVWTPTATPNLCVVDCSNILSNNTVGISASSYQGVNVPAKAFDGSFNTVVTKWSSSGTNYNASGNYIGSNVTQGISGEWLQVQLSSPSNCRNYYVVVSVSDASAIPKSWSLLGSNNGSSWTTIDTFNYGTSISPNNDWKYPFVCLPLTVTNTNTYSYYRIVFTSNFGANYINIADIALFDSGMKQLDQYIRPIVLKDLILHPTRILSVDGATPNIYRITDLSCNLIRNGVVHGGYYVNNTIYGLTAEPVATTFDGVHHFVFSASGEVAYLSNTASNTNLNFDNSMNGVAISGVGLSNTGACYNRKFVLAGSKYGVFNENTVSTFYTNNLASVLTTVNCIASNSGYGFVVSPNTIYLKEDERLNVVTPKFYDAALSSDTSISFNVYKASEV